MPPPDPLQQPEAIQPGMPPPIPGQMDIPATPSGQMALFQDQLAADLAVPPLPGPVAPANPPDLPVPDQQHEDDMSRLMDKLEASIESQGRQAELDYIMDVMEGAVEMEPPAPLEVPPPATDETEEHGEEIYTGPQGPIGPSAPPPGLIDEPSGRRPYIEPATPPRRGGGGGRPRAQSFRPKASYIFSKGYKTSRPFRCPGEDKCGECPCSGRDSCPHKANHENKGGGS